MMYRKILAGGIALLFGFSAQASVDRFSGKTFVTKLFAEVPGYDLQFKSQIHSKNLKFQPHVAGVTGVSVSLLGLFGVGYGFRNPIKEEDLNKKGKTDYEDWRFSFAYDEFNLDLNYQSYEGFYLENSETVDPSWSSGQDFLQYPDMKLENISLNFTYVWSPDDFSLAAPLDHTVRQNKSGGSFLLGAAVNQTRFSNSEGLFPDAVAAQYGDDQNLTEVRFLALTAKAGYGYTFIWSENWYASLAALLGGGVHLGKFNTPTTSYDKQDSSYKADALISIGYNGDSFLSGLTATADSTSFKTDSTEISSNIWKLRLFLGARF